MARITHRNDRMHRGLVPTAQLGSGSATSSTVLLGNQTWGSVPGTSFGSNSNSVGSANAPGASSSNARADHVHQGVHQLTSNGSNGRFEDVNFAAGSGIALGVAGQTVTITNTGSSGGAAGGSTLTIEEADGSPTGSATKLVLPNGTLAYAGTVATYTPASSGGDLARLAETVLGADAADITITGLSGSYRDLIVILRVRSTNGGAGLATRVQLGTGSIDTGSHYSYYETYAGWVAGTNQNAAGDTSWNVCICPNSTATSGYFGYGRFEILNYASTTKTKGMIGQGYAIDGSGHLATQVQGMWDDTTGAINQIKVFPSAGNLLAGSAMTIYGRA